MSLEGPPGILDMVPAEKHADLEARARQSSELLRTAMMGKAPVLGSSTPEPAWAGINPH